MADPTITISTSWSVMSPEIPAIELQAYNELVWSANAYLDKNLTLSGYVWPLVSTPTIKPPYPVGKGILVWQQDKVANQDPTIKEFKWVAPKFTDGAVQLKPTKFYNNIKNKTEVWGWGYTYGGSIQKAESEAAAAATAVSDYSLRGWFIDAEQQYKVPAGKMWATAFINKFKAIMPDTPLGLCSYRYPKLHPEFPWNEFLAGCVFHAPQVYWIQNNDPMAPKYQVEESYSQLRSIKNLHFVPIGVACEENGWKPSPAQINTFKKTVVDLGLPSGYGWWEWAQAEKIPSIWAEI